MGHFPNDLHVMLHDQLLGFDHLILEKQIHTIIKFHPNEVCHQPIC